MTTVCQSSDELAIPLECYSRTSSGQTEAQQSGKQEYSSANFWESRFQDTEGTFDWYATYNELEDTFQEFCPPSPDTDVLVVGCGNSGLSAELHTAGFRRIVNIDISAAAVAMMENQSKDLGMQWSIMDATAMSFEDSSFDVVIDKGTLDAMMSGGDVDAAAAMSREIWRTVRPGGHFLAVSHNASRHALLEDGALDARPPEQQDDGLAWEGLELRKTRLSPQATLINILRSKLQGRPMSQAIKDPEMLKAATIEAKHAMKQMQFIEAFRMFKARKARIASEKNGTELHPRPTELLVQPADEAEKALENEDGEKVSSSDARLQPYCWTYVLRKPV